MFTTINIIIIIIFFFLSLLVFFQLLQFSCWDIYITTANMIV